MPKKVVIIGAGIAGLSAGCYACMNGYDAEIYEAHTQSGGLCTAWQRKGYTIDGCIQYFTGSSPNYSFYRVWEELGAVQGRRMVDPKVITRFIGTDGRIFVVYSDVDKLEKHMLELSHQDSGNIKLLCRLVRRFTKFQIPVGKPFEMYNVFDFIPLVIKMLPLSKDLNFCQGMTIGNFVARFKDPLLRGTLTKLLWVEDYPLLSLVITLSVFHMKAGGLPEGGSLEFVRAIEKRYLALGGKIFFKQKVTKILEEKSRAVGIRLSDGREIKGDYVISAADLRMTLYDLLEGKHVDPIHEELFQTCKLCPPIVQVAFGVNMDFSSKSETLSETIQLTNPIMIGNQPVNWIAVRHYSYDKNLAPADKSLVECHFLVEDFQYWEKLAMDKNQYRSVKENIVASVTECLDNIYPKFKSSIEVVDVATPMTYIRYTGNWKGTYMTWVITPDKVKRFRVVKKTVPGLDNFWLSGMWVQPPGGIPTGAMTSREIIQIICKKDKKRFKTSIPAIG